MKKITVLFLFFIGMIMISKGQSMAISGQIFDQKNQTIIGANVVLLHPKDSTIITGTTSDYYGNFKIDISKPQKVLIKVSFIGFEDVFISKDILNKSILLGKIVMKDKVTDLKEVTISAQAISVVQSGDTTQINAGAFKTNPDANAEDLITKMPGISIQDGKVQAQGETVQKVTVDGQEFFGDDASAVLKNLPAEVVDKIEIFDKKSDQSEASGFDDGNTTKTINVITKVQFRNGVFGKAFGGYGFEDKWKAGLNLNFFKDKRRISILASSNNVNEQNFSSEDLLGVMSSGGASSNSNKRGGGRQGGGSASNDAGSFLVDQKSGITTTHSLGLNYANQWKKLNFSGSYFINYTDNNAITDLYRQYITAQNEGLTYSETQEKSSQNINHRLNFKIDWKIDSLNSIKFQPKVSVQQNDGTNGLMGKNLLLTALQSFVSNDYKSNLTGLNISAPIQYRHSFRKKGRMFSINLSLGFNQNMGDNYNNSIVQFYADTLPSDLFNQKANQDLLGKTISSNFTYTEPITKQSQLMFSYGNSYNYSKSNKETYNYSNSNADYSIFDTTLSNNYSSQYVFHNIGTSYRFQQTKWNFSTGVSFQYSQLDGEQVFPFAYTIGKSFNNILPNAQFQYKFSKKKNLRINYRSSNKAPSVNQLQNVINNTNPLQLSTGNPNLKQNWQNSVTLRYSTSNTEKSTSFMTLLSCTFIQNYVVTNSIIAMNDSVVAPGITLARGSQLSMPINLDGYFNVRSFNIYSFPIPKLKSFLNLNFGGTYAKTPGMINHELNYSNTYNAGFGFAISSNISENIDFTLSSNTTYNNISNSLLSGSNSEYYNQNTKFKMQIMPWKWMVFQSDVAHQYNSGLSASYNQNYFLWNAALGFKFLKDNSAELRLSVYDIMKQNNSISRNTTETYYEDIRSNVLQQYMLLTFSYNIKYYKDTK